MRAIRLCPSLVLTGILIFVASTLTASPSFALDTAASDAAAKPFVSPIFGDNMVLQRDKLNTIWGWSEPGDSVRVEIADHSATAVAAADGRWQVKIRPPAVGGPYVVKIRGRQTVDLHEVLVGDVWLCGGQSNMQLPLSRARNGADEIKAADHPEIRFFFVQQHPAYSRAEVPKGTWKIVTPQTAGDGAWGGISATAYYFALKLQETLHMPIGLIVDCVGGTPAETWTSPEALRPLKDFDVPLAELERLHARGGSEYGNYIMHWYEDYDPGAKGNSWADPNVDDSTWKAVQIPGDFAELGVAGVPNVSWFRREITLPDPLPAGRVQLLLGSIEKMDTTYINGRWVGASSWVENPRAYTVPDGLLKPGRNQITIRVFKIKADGGFLSKPDALRMVLGD